MSRRSAELLVTLANGLSLSRLFAVPVVVFLVWRSADVDSYRYAAFWLIAALHGGDMIDGYLARKGSRRLRVRNHFGEMIDPCADKTYTGAALITLALTDQIVAWFVVLAIARDAAILGCWTAIYKRFGVRILPNLAGKVTDASLAIVIGVVLLRVEHGVIPFVTYASTGLILYSGYVYGGVAVRAVAAARFRQLRFAVSARRKRVGMARGGIGPASS